MKKTILGILIISLAAVLTASIASALPGKRKGPPSFSDDLPESKLTRIVFIRHAPGREPLCDNDGICEAKENWKKCPNDCQKGDEEEPPQNLCYGFLSGAKPKWNWVENYRYDDIDIKKSSETATGIWNDATSATIFEEGLAGAGAWGSYDGKNSIVYDDYPQEGVLGVTAIWFRGKSIYEYDIMFDVDYFPGDNSIDLDTVVLHEFGHGAGLDDLYTTDCDGEVMYGYYHGVDLDLGAGDAAGIETLYGI